MSLWLDLLGAEIRFVDTASFGRIRVAEAGRGQEPLLFLHGIGGHLEAYAKNVVPLSDRFHTLAFDYVGHGLSEKKVLDFTPLTFVDQLGELLDALGLGRVNLSGESLGGWVSALFAVKHPERVRRLMLNTAGGIPIVGEKGRADLENLKALSQKNAGQTPTFESVQARMAWLIHPNNRHLLTDELVRTRLFFYLQPGMREVAPRVLAIIPRHDEFLIPLEKISCETLFLWTLDNPVHDVESARRACAEVPRAELYVMKADAAHWPQYEAAGEFNDVTRRFFTSGRIGRP
ncbi:MAG: alpha/beta hydrolase [Deltaproteobacteria bacterium]|nr:alpha/beta hydrolase [Deltaproteobacteria bacterium]